MSQTSDEIQRLAEQLATPLSYLLQRSARMIPYGTAYPTTGAGAGSLFYRTDLGSLAEYDGTGWRTFEERTADAIHAGFVTPTDHFRESSLDPAWAWAADAPFDGAPSTISLATLPSCLFCANNDSTEDFFLYQPVSGVSNIVARFIPPTVGTYVGVRIDGGNDNDYAEIRWVVGTGAGLRKLQVRARTGGGAVTTTDFADGLPVHPIALYLSNGSSMFTYYTLEPATVTSANSYHFLSTARAQLASASRAGLIFGLSTDGSRAMICDWAHINA